MTTPTPISNNLVSRPAQSGSATAVGQRSQRAGQPGFGSGFEALLRSTPTAIIRTAENSQSISKFTQDTLSVWAPKCAISRSWAERVEMTFLEFVESGLFYFAPALVGQHIFKKLMFNASPLKKQPQLLKWLSKPLAQAPKALQKKLLPVKAAVVIASGGILLAEYSLSFVKNLLTENLFKKSKFSDVISLSEGSIDHQEVTPARIKAYRRIKQSFALSAAAIAAAAFIAAKGTKIKGLQKPLQTLIKHLDFNFSKNGDYGLNRSQMRLTIFAGVIGYHDAARDNLELFEVFSRVAMVVAPYLMFGDQLIQGAMAQHWFKGLLNKTAKVAQPIEERTLQKIFGPNFFVNQWLKSGHQVKSVAEIEALGATQPNLAKNLLKAKQAHFYISQAIGILGVGLIVTLMSQAWTRYRFNRAQEQQQLKNDLKSLTPPQQVPSTEAVTPHRPQTLWVSYQQQLSQPVAAPLPSWASSLGQQPFQPHRGSSFPATNWGTLANQAFQRRNETPGLSPT